MTTLPPNCVALKLAPCMTSQPLVGNNPPACRSIGVPVSSALTTWVPPRICPATVAPGDMLRTPECRHRSRTAAAGAAAHAAHAHGATPDFDAIAA
jgi:hypothetical protein